MKFLISFRAFYLFFLFFFVVLSTSIGFSQTVGHLTWSQALSEVQAQNADLKAAEAQVQAAQSQLRVSQSAYWPQVSGNLSYGTDSNSATSFGAQLAVTQNLFSGFADQAKVQQAEIKLDLARLNLLMVASRVRGDLMLAFANLLTVQKSIKLSEEILQRRKINLSLVELRFDGGGENRGSVLLSKAYFEQAQYENLQARHSLLTAKTQLAQVLGRESSDDLIDKLQVDGDIPLPEGLDENSNSDFQIKQWVLQSNEYLQAVAQQKLSEAGLSLSQASFYPSLNLSGTTGVVGPTWFPNQDRWTAGATLNWPLWSGGSERANQQVAQASLLAAQFSRKSAEQILLLRIRQALAGFLEAQQKLKVDEAFLQAGQVRAKIAKEKYNNGMARFDEWDLIENDLIIRQKSRLSANRDLISAAVAWEKLFARDIDK